MVPPQTQPMQQAGLPLRALAVTVVEGPDQGKRSAALTERITVGTAADNELVLTDPSVSRYHLELSRDGDRVRVRDVGSTNGTQAGAVELDTGTVPAGTRLTLGRTTLEVTDGQTVTVELHPGESLGPLKGRSEVMRRLMTKVAKVAKSDVAVLLSGESGTGKELLARALHEQSPRAKAPFVTVDCGSLAPGLVASELFGHEKGAFTGAERRHVGAFERAQGGTVFLDEIGELPQALQSTLLGAVERKSFRRVGGAEQVEVDVRIVSATHRDLRAEVNASTFRLDLFYRLAVVKLEVPPLRERAEDVPLLVEHFLREAGHGGPVEELVSDRAMESLQKHYWPGNVRELRNLVEATLAMGEAPALESGQQGRPSPAAALDERSYKDARADALQAFERAYLGGLIDRAKGNVSEASRLARMDRSHLIELLKKHGLK
ncbi:MAG: sigma 54-dependent Fis family transcriptional regulator [Archangiaceae bacterium]|nr:sigma 54-dependent Fis family transcriptional regulator [Archangiaceae bacterium]